MAYGEWIVAMNEGFWDLPAVERGAAYDWAEETYGGDFWDLTPEQRGSAYEWASERRGGGYGP